jgi:uncharacterized alpha-E superfamily protein
MMLASTADHLFWMSRYVERADNLSRILTAASRIAAVPQIYGEEPTNEWESALHTAACVDSFYELGREASAENVFAWIAFDEENPSSIANCIRSARTSARIVRTALTNETWESINSAYLELKRFPATDASPRAMNRFIDWTRQVSMQVAGSQFRNMLRTDAYWFSRLGMYIERADNTTRILDVKYHVLLPAHERVGGGVDYYQWASILRSVSALTAYHWVYRQSIKPWLVADLLLLREEMPRSLAACYLNITSFLDELAMVHGRQGPSQRAARALHAKLRNARMEDIFNSGLHEFLEELLGENERISDTIAEQYYLN